MRTHISTILADAGGYRPDIPDLRHTENRTRPAYQEGNQRRNPDRQLLSLVPRRPVVPSCPPENDLFLDRDRDPDRHPVPHQREEVGEDLAQMITSSEGADHVDDDADGVPDQARDSREPAAEDLEVDAHHVRGRHTVGD